MKRIVYRMTIMLLFLTVMTNAESNKLSKKCRTECNAMNKQQSFMDCLPSTTTSSIVGVFTGGLTRYLEKEFKIEQSKDRIIFMMIAWLIEQRVRLAAINELEKDFIEANIPHKKSLMNFFSWASSWCSYLAM